MTWYPTAYEPSRGLLGPQNAGLEEGLPSIDAVLARARAATPSRVAVHEWETGRQVTYAMLDDWSSAIACFLRSRLDPGDRVAVHLPNGAEFLAAAFGGFRAGCVTTYVNHRLLPEEAARQVLLAQARVVVTTADRATRLAVNPELSDVVLVVVDGASPRGIALDALLAQAHGGAVDVPCDGDADALLRFTSGSTGTPKGVLVSHRAWLLRAVSILTEEIRVEDGAMTMVLGPLSHQAGLFVLPTFLRCGTVLVFEKFDIAALAQAVSTLPVRRTQMVPTMLRMVLDTPAAVAALATAPVLREVIYGGSPVEAGVLDRAFELFPTLGFIQSYGSHEAGSISVLDDASHRDPRFRLSAGRPFYAAEVRVQRDGTNAWGEIEVRAPWTPRARVTEAGRVPVLDEWIPTGDLGEIRDGHLFLKDRTNGVIVSGGFNVYPMEIEDAINRCPGVLSSAVVSAPDPRWGERVVAFVVTRDPAVVESGTLREHCRRILANFKVPKEFHLLDEIPVNPNGKPDRRRLSAPFWEGRERRIN